MQEKAGASELMYRDASSRLEGKDPSVIAMRSGVTFDYESNCFTFTTFGKEVRLSYPDYIFTPDLPSWHALCILHYLDLADGTPLTGEYISFSQIKDGMVRGGGFDRRFESVCSEIFSSFDNDEIIRRIEAFGSNRIDTNADYSAVISFMPYYPLLLKVWFSDDEFPPSGKLMVDRNDTYLSIEDAVTVGEIVIEKIKEQ